MIAADSTRSSTAIAGAAAGPPLIVIEDVTMRFPIPKRYREWALHPLQPRRVTTALTHVSVEIQAGDRIAVMGPNGAGKTTLLKLIGGLLLPTEGRILVKGSSTLDDTAARQSVGFVFNEERSFFWRLTGVQNLEFFGALDNLHRRELRDRVQYLLELVGLKNDGNKMVSAYSAGMKQRLAIARVLIADPDVLIFDEPTRALDPIACDEFVELILATIHRDFKKTLLIATHRSEDASLLCNKVMIVEDGRIQSSKSIDELRSEGLSVLEHYRSLVVRRRTS